MASMQAKVCSGRIHVQSRFLIPQVTRSDDSAETPPIVPRPPSTSRPSFRVWTSEICDNHQESEQKPSTPTIRDVIMNQCGKENLVPQAENIMQPAPVHTGRPPTIPKLKQPGQNTNDSGTGHQLGFKMLPRSRRASDCSQASEEALHIAACKVSPRIVVAAQKVDKPAAVIRSPSRRPSSRGRPASVQRAKRPSSVGASSARRTDCEGGGLFRKGSCGVELASRGRPRHRFSVPFPASLPPPVSAKAWIALDATSGRVVGGSSQRVRMGMASLTKIMTCHMVVQLAKTEPAVLEETLTVSERAARVVGTSAKLLPGDTLKVGDALYGLMLPSGNDAALALAEHFGDRMRRRRLLVRSIGRSKATPLAGHLHLKLPPADRGAACRDAPDVVRFWVADMNAHALGLGLHSTSFTNPHGLSAPLHQSTAEDMALLCKHAMEDPLFAEIVGTVSKRSVVYNEDEDEQRELIWTNTNELLGEGYCGIKTGTTPTTGFCLASEFRVRDGTIGSTSPKAGEEGSGRKRGRGRRLVVVVLASATKHERTADTRALVQWAVAAMGQRP